MYDDDKRVAISRDLVAADLGATFLHYHSTSDFAQIFDILYLRHEAIRDAGRRPWTRAELTARGARRANAALS